MRKFKYLFLSIIITFVAYLFSFNLQVHAENTNTSAPYYTYTADSDGFLIRTTEAYTPNKRITSIDGVEFDNLTHVFVDKEDYIYITDSDIKTRLQKFDPETGEVIINPITGLPATELYLGKISILDQNFQLVGEILNKDIDSPLSTYVTEEEIYVVYDSQIVEYNKEAFLSEKTLQIDKVITKPTHPIFQDKKDEDGKRIPGYSFQPEHIVVDPRGNIYVQGGNSKNGLIMLDEDGNFMTFFGGNPLRIPIIDRIRSFFMTEKQEDNLQKITDKKIITDVPSNIALDEKGYVYTVTSSIPANPIKKFNVSGRNFFKEDMIGTLGMSSIWVGQYNNVFAVNKDGYIFEYDTNGNLLFFFGGSGEGKRIGLLGVPVSIATTSSDMLLVADQGNNLIQVYKPTEFTNKIHDAFNAYYKEGDYDTSQANWEYILQYNSLFDYAHIGLGDAFMRNHEYDKAYQEYYFANDYVGLSDAYWGIRQDFMRQHLNTVILIIVLLLIVRVVYYFLNKKYHYSETIGKGVQKLRDKNHILDELLYIFRFLKHPFDGFYEIKREGRVSVTTSTIIFILLGVLFALNYRFTNLIFVPKVGVNITYELFVLGLILLLWVVSNYLVCSINDGEGSIKNVYNATAYAFTPIIVIMPIIILGSHLLTLQEFVFYQFGYIIMTGWTVFLMFFMIKDIHNYSVKKTFGVIFKSMFTMLILGLFIFVVGALGNQMLTVLKGIIQEVINR